MNIIKIQELLQKYKMDGWLFSDFHGQDSITQEFLGLRGKVFSSRRLFYFIPSKGEPVKLLSAIEPLLLNDLPGTPRLYKGRKELHDQLANLLPKGAAVACQYSPEGNVPTVSTMDAGLMEYLKGFGIRPVTSADLLQHFGAVLTEEQIQSHKEAGGVVHRILENTFRWIRNGLDTGKTIDEWMLLQKMKELVEKEDLVMDGPPFFGVDEHGANPGYEPTPETAVQIREGSRLIIDFAGRLKGEDTIYYDISWCMQVGKQVDPKYARLFQIVKDARNGAVDFIRERIKAGKPICGYEVDQYTTNLFREKGLERYIMHRTGHNIGHNCHGIGANLDDYETHDDRRLLPGTMFSVEPGIYTEKYGVRLEYDVHITPAHQVKIYGPIQEKILCI